MHRNKQKYRYILLIFVLLCLSGCQKSEDAVKDIELKDIELKEIEAGEVKAEQDYKKKGSEKIAEKSKLYVHVCGQVLTPGVYELPSDARVFDAISAAGGMLETADGEALNQAKVLEDGQQLYVPTKGEALATTAEASRQEEAVSDDKVDINKATKEELMKINGVGEARASSIVKYREEHGDFQFIEELKEIEGIKEGMFNKLKDQVKVG